MRLSKAITMATIILKKITDRSVYKDVAGLILTNTTSSTNTKFHGMIIQTVNHSA
jgi:hypothetical protein